MNEETKAALLGSIKKWKDIEDGTGKDHGSANCPLCKMFLTVKSSCHGCPVMERTGKILCQDSPYDQWKDRPLDEFTHKELATAEREFLEGLLEE